MESAKPIVVACRTHLDTAIADGPQMDPVPTYELSDMKVGLTSVTMRARTGIDLRALYDPAVHGGSIPVADGAPAVTPPPR